MARLQSILIIQATAVVLLAMSACAQNGPDNTVGPVNCSAALSMGFVPTQLAGQWYEVARHPSPPKFMACIGVDMRIIGNNDTMQINVTYANDNKHLYQNQTITANVSLENSGTASTAGVNITYTFESTSLQTITYKLLGTDYNTYAFICGYTNLTDIASEFGMVLVRDRGVNGTALQNYEKSAAANFTNFLNGTMTQITQTADCYTKSDAGTTLPFLAPIMTAIYMLLKVVC